MTRDVNVALRNLAGEFGVSLRGLTDDDLQAVALRFLAEDRHNAEALRSIVEDVRALGHALAGEAGVTQMASASPSRGLHFNASEATEAKLRQRLARAHLSENARTGLYLVPRRPQRLPVNKPHPACLALARERRVPCRRCRWLLGDEPYTEFWLDRDD